MTNNPTRKQAQTSYGRIEYDTLPCEECTNETVVGDVTHVYTADSTADVHHASPEDCHAHTVCTGCITEQYGFDEGVLTHVALQEWYDEQSWPIQLERINDLAFEQREEPTPHGTVDIEIAECSHCEGEWITDELCAVYIPVATVNDELHAAVRLYCPDCRELYLDAPDQTGVALDSFVDDGKTVAEQRIEERDAREARADENSKTSLRTRRGVHGPRARHASDNRSDGDAKGHLKAAVGWFLLGIISTSIFGSIGLSGLGVVVLTVCWLIAARYELPKAIFELMPS